MSSFINADCLDIMRLPLTRIELRVRSSKVKKKMEEKQND